MRRAGLVTYVNRKNRAAARQDKAEARERNAQTTKERECQPAASRSCAKCAVTPKTSAKLIGTNNNECRRACRSAERRALLGYQEGAAKRQAWAKVGRATIDRGTSGRIGAALEGRGRHESTRRGCPAALCRYAVKRFSLDNEPETLVSVGYPGKRQSTDSSSAPLPCSAAMC